MDGWWWWWAHRGDHQQQVAVEDPELDGGGLTAGGELSRRDCQVCRFAEHGNDRDVCRHDHRAGILVLEADGRALLAGPVYDRALGEAASRYELTHRLVPGCTGAPNRQCVPVV